MNVFKLSLIVLDLMPANSTLSIIGASTTVINNFWSKTFTLTFSKKFVSYKFFIIWLSFLFVILFPILNSENKIIVSFEILSFPLIWMFFIWVALEIENKKTKFKL